MPTPNVGRGAVPRTIVDEQHLLDQIALGPDTGEAAIDPGKTLIGNDGDGDRHRPVLRRATRCSVETRHGMVAVVQSDARISAPGPGSGWPRSTRPRRPSRHSMSCCALSGSTTQP